MLLAKKLVEELLHLDSKRMPCFNIKDKWERKKHVVQIKVVAFALIFNILTQIQLVCLSKRLIASTANE